MTMACKSSSLHVSEEERSESSDIDDDVGSYNDDDEYLKFKEDIRICSESEIEDEEDSIQSMESEDSSHMSTSDMDPLESEEENESGWASFAEESDVEDRPASASTDRTTKSSKDQPRKENSRNQEASSRDKKNKKSRGDSKHKKTAKGKKKRKSKERRIEDLSSSPVTKKSCSEDRKRNICGSKSMEIDDNLRKRREKGDRSKSTHQRSANSGPSDSVKHRNESRSQSSHHRSLKVDDATSSKTRSKNLSKSKHHRSIKMDSSDGLGTKNEHRSKSSHHRSMAMRPIDELGTQSEHRSRKHHPKSRSKSTHHRGIKMDSSDGLGTKSEHRSKSSHHRSMAMRPIDELGTKSEHRPNTFHRTTKLTSSSLLPIKENKSHSSHHQNTKNNESDELAASSYHRRTSHRRNETSQTTAGMGSGSGHRAKLTEITSGSGHRSQSTDRGNGSGRRSRSTQLLGKGSGHRSRSTELGKGSGHRSKSKELGRGSGHHSESTHQRSINIDQSVELEANRRGSLGALYRNSILMGQAGQSGTGRRGSLSSLYSSGEYCVSRGGSVSAHSRTIPMDGCEDSLESSLSRLSLSSHSRSMPVDGTSEAPSGGAVATPFKRTGRRLSLSSHCRSIQIGREEDLLSSSEHTPQQTGNRHRSGSVHRRTISVDSGEGAPLPIGTTSDEEQPAASGLRCNLSSEQLSSLLGNVTSKPVDFDQIEDQMALRLHRKDSKHIHKQTGLVDRGKQAEALLREERSSVHRRASFHRVSRRGRVCRSFSAESCLGNTGPRRASRKGVARTPSAEGSLQMLRDARREAKKKRLMSGSVGGITDFIVSPPAGEISVGESLVADVESAGAVVAPSFMPALEKSVHTQLGCFAMDPERNDVEAQLDMSRIPIELQSIFLASSRGEVVDKPPEDGTADKMFDRPNWLSKWKKKARK